MKQNGVRSVRSRETPQRLAGGSGRNNQKVITVLYIFRVNNANYSLHFGNYIGQSI